MKEVEKSGSRAMGIWELTRYRLNKKVPASLSFDERKKLLLSSEEWKYYSSTHHKPTSEDEITEENIQNVMDNVVNTYGSALTTKYQKLEWVKMAFNSNICKVYID